MKKISTLCLLLLYALQLLAQMCPERMVVHRKGGSVQGTLVENIDSVTFPRIEGRVAADPQIISITKDSVILNITRTPPCKTFKLVDLSADLVNDLSDENLKDYIKRHPQISIYSKDYEKGVLKNTEWTSDSQYFIVTLGYDKYNTPCSIVRTPFHTLKSDLIGNPKVTSTLEELTQRIFTFTFCPNEDVAGYAIYAAIAGTAQQAYEENKYSWGFKEFGELIKAWGIIGNRGSRIQQIWNGMEPNTDYEVFVQPWDANGTLANCDTIKVHTKGYGDNGVAEVFVTLGAYQMSKWGNQSQPSQIITYTPNEQTACYRFDLLLKSDFDKNPDIYKYKLAKDPPFPMENWFFYEQLTTDYQIDPNTEYTILTAAKNAEGVWSEVKVEHHTTPASVEGKVYIPKRQQLAIGKRDCLKTSFYTCKAMTPK